MSRPDTPLMRGAFFALVLAAGCSDSADRSGRLDAATPDATPADPVVKIVVVGPPTTAPTTVHLSLHSPVVVDSQPHDLVITDSLDTPHVLEISLPRLRTPSFFGVYATTEWPMLCGSSDFGVPRAVSSVEVLVELSTCRPSAGQACTGGGCAPQASGRYCVAGRVSRFRDDTMRLEERTWLGHRDGACVKAYSAVDFAAGNLQPLGTPAEAQLDDDGCYLIADVPETSTRSLVVAVDDCGETPATIPQGLWALTAVPAQQVAGTQTIDLSKELVSATAITTLEAQSLGAQAEMAGHPNLLGQGGAYILIFRDPRSTPYAAVPGVVPTATNGYLDGSHTIYFGADLGTLDPARPYAMGVSAPTGAALITAPQVANHTGMSTQGGPGWDRILLGATDGAFVVNRFRLAPQ